MLVKSLISGDNTQLTYGKNLAKDVLVQNFLGLNSHMSHLRHFGLKTPWLLMICLATVPTGVQL